MGYMQSFFIKKFHKTFVKLQENLLPLKGTKYRCCVLQHLDTDQLLSAVDQITQTDFQE
uniref:Uncharacterized protein n=1 Tax=Salvator merianae TaxID=96440 RepID=A0A8D0KDD1_SALMN